jgi:hypothetical protein
MVFLMINFNVSPSNVKFVNYNYQIFFPYFIAYQSSLDFTFKKILERPLTLSIYADDILNTNKNGFNSFETHY